MRNLSAYFFKSKMIFIGFLFVLILLPSLSKSADDCRNELGNSYSADAFSKCLRDDQILNPSPNTSQDSVELTKTPGYIYGLILGSDTLESIHTRNPGLLPIICTSVSSKNASECEDKSYFLQNNISIPTRFGIIEITKNETKQPEINLSTYISMNVNQSFKMYFFKDKLFMVQPLDTSGNEILPKDFNYTLLKQSLSKKYKVSKSWNLKSVGNVTKVDSWTMTPNVSVELVESLSHYKNREDVRELQQLYRLASKNVPELATRVYDLELIILNNKFPVNITENYRIRYIDNKALLDLSNAIEKLKRQNKDIQNQEKRAQDLKEIQKY